MAKFKIEVQEIAQKIFEVEANDVNEAIAAVIFDYQEGRKQLAPEDLKETIVRQYATYEHWHGREPSVVLS